MSRPLLSRPLTHAAALAAGLFVGPSAFGQTYFHAPPSGPGNYGSGFDVRVELGRGPIYEPRYPSPTAGRHRPSHLQMAAVSPRMMPATPLPTSVPGFASSVPPVPPPSPSVPSPSMSSAATAMSPLPTISPAQPGLLSPSPAAAPLAPPAEPVSPPPAATSAPEDPFASAVPAPIFAPAAETTETSAEPMTPTEPMTPVEPFAEPLMAPPVEEPGTSGPEFFAPPQPLEPSAAPAEFTEPVLLTPASAPVSASRAAAPPALARTFSRAAVDRAAAAEFAEVAGRPPVAPAQDPSFAVTLARTCEANANWAAAASAYGVAVGMAPDDVRLRARRADCLYLAGAFADAAAEYAAAEAAGGPLAPAEYARFGDAALRIGKPDDAARAFDALAAAEPTPRVEALRGLAALKRGDADGGRAILTAAAARWPGDPALAQVATLAGGTAEPDDAGPTITPASAVVPAPVADEPLPVIVPASAVKTDEGWRKAAEQVPVITPAGGTAEG